MNGVMVLMILAQGWYDIGDEGGDDWGYAVCVDGSDNIIVAGNSYTDAATGTDAYIWKYDPAGTILWEMPIPSPGGEWVRGVDVDDNDNIYICMTDYTGDEIRILKYRPNGSFAWNLSFGSDGDTIYEAQDIRVDGDMVFVTGYSIDTVNMIQEEDRMVLLYVDTSGSLVRAIFWDTGWGLGSDAFGYAVAVSPGGDPVVGGYYANFPSTDYRGVLVGFSRATGNETWRQTINDFSPSGVETPEDMDIHPGGDIVLVIRVETTPKSAVVGRYTSTGGVIWEETISDPSLRRNLYGVALGPGDTILVAGLAENTSGNRDFWLRKYPWGGPPWVWDTTIDHTPGQDDWAEACAWDSYGYIIAAGGTTRGNRDMLVYKLPIPPVAVDESSKPSRGYSVFPNPFSNEIAVRGAEGPFSVFDASGRLVLRTSQRSFGRSLDPGVYFVVPRGQRPIRVVKVE